MVCKKHLFVPMDNIPTRKVTVEEAVLELEQAAKRVKRALKVSEKLKWVSQDTLDLEIII